MICLYNKEVKARSWILLLIICAWAGAGYFRYLKFSISKPLLQFTRTVAAVLAEVLVVMRYDRDPSGAVNSSGF
jgi:hypothetical protein